jgi:hypothetical protein
MHPSAERLYLAARSFGVEGQSAVARWLNEAPQTINNWEKRGVSMRGALEAQKKTGHSAAWILEGGDEPVAFRRRAASGRSRAAACENLSPEEQQLIANLRAIGDEDEKRHLLEEIARKAARNRAPRRKVPGPAPGRSR